MADPPHRPRVFLDVQSGPEHFGRIGIELFADKAPKTSDNFRTICTSSYTPSSATKPLTYKLSPFHRIIDDFMIQGGDITAGDGTGGTSIYDGEFEDENIGWRDIDKEGLVCMANRGKGTNSSQFFITLAACPHLNAKHTVFGHVVGGLDTVHRMAKVQVDSKDCPQTEIIISHCGELERRKKAMVSASKTQISNRGRKRATRSPSSSRSPSPPHHNHHTKSAQPLSRPPRRRSDFNLDETRRGRTLTRSPSPHVLSQSPPHKRRRRGLPPSRSRSRHSQSPHLRRRHTKSRMRSLERDRSGRDGRRERRVGDAMDEGYDQRYDRYWRRHRGEGYGVREKRSEYDGYDGAGRLDGGDFGGHVKFKGRGSMKYREKKW